MYKNKIITKKKTFVRQNIDLYYKKMCYKNINFKMQKNLFQFYHNNDK